MHASLLHQDTGAWSKVGRFVMRRRTETYAAERPRGRSFASMLRFGGRPSKLNSGPIMKWRRFLSPSLRSTGRHVSRYLTAVITPSLWRAV
jgi:hypothetical protein